MKILNWKFYATFIFSIQNIKRNRYTILFNFFPNHLFLMRNLSSHLYLFIRGSILVILTGCLPIFWWFSTIVTACWKHLLLFSNDGVYCCFFAFYPIRRIYARSIKIRIDFMTFVMQYCLLGLILSEKWHDLTWPHIGPKTVIMIMIDNNDNDR